MEQHTQRRVAYGVLALAVSALVVEKVFLDRGPAAAHAAAQSEASVNEVLAKAVSSGTTSALGTSFTQRLLELESKNAGGAQGDALIAPQSWFPQATAAADPTASIEAESSDSLRQRHALTAILGRKDRPSVVVDGVVLVKGEPTPVGKDVVMTLVEVRERSAIVTVGDARVELELNDAASPGVRLRRSEGSPGASVPPAPSATGSR